MTEAEELFLELVDRRPEERAEILALLERPLRQEVESLLEHASSNDADLQGIVERAAIWAERGLAPERIGPWKLGARIGRGGMSDVYLGERDDPEFTQRVAIKLFHRRLAGQTRRLLQERKILARLSHPSIAQLFDGGVTADGQPYLVLEYVEGQEIDAHVFGNKLELRQRLALFCKVAEAVEYAHRQLVVHRDLKPSNVLVTAEGVPKLLDFGIAKALEDPDGRGATQAMTLDYASPEQVRGEAASPSMDVYALGVLLHGMLTGKTPFDLWLLPLDRALEKVLHEEAGTVQGVPRDLARIVRKSLEKDSGRRYGSVEALRADVERFLRWEPVEARGGGGAYRLWRFVQRRWVVVGSLAAIFVAVVVALVVTTRALAETERQRAEAVRARTLAEREHDRAEQLAAEARAQRDLAERRAVALSQQVARADENLATARSNASAVTHMLDQQFVNGGSRQALATVDEWLQVQRGVVEKRPGDAEALKLLGILEGRRCAFLAAENAKAAQADCESSVKHLGPLEDSAQADDWLRTSLSASRAMLGRQKAMSGAMEEGLRELDLAARTLEPALAKNPGDGSLQARRATVRMYRGDVLLRAGRTGDAARAYAQALEELRQARGGVENRPLYQQLAGAAGRFGKLLEGKDPAQSRRLYRESLNAFRQLAEAPRSQMVDWNEYANAINECPYPELRNVAHALLYAQKAVTATEGKNPSALDTLAWAQYRAGKAAEAVETQKKAIALVPASASQFRALLEKGLQEFEKGLGK
ncbi:MAG: protein kinase [Bryobacterales bacterium]|nr:protein kinase [Bryobacterales bacterium]